MTFVIEFYYKCTIYTDTVINNKQHITNFIVVK
jgi:hypothetical protein